MDIRNPCRSKWKSGIQLEIRRPKSGIRNPGRNPEAKKWKSGSRKPRRGHTDCHALIPHACASVPLTARRRTNAVLTGMLTAAVLVYGRAARILAEAEPGRSTATCLELDRPSEVPADDGRAGRAAIAGAAVVAEGMLSAS